MKILTKWRNFKVIKAKHMELLGNNGFAAEGHNDKHETSRPKPLENKIY
jgi:hypothetical protein